MAEDTMTAPQRVRFVRALGAISVWNGLPALLLIIGFSRGLNFYDEAVSHLIARAFVATFFGALILRLIAWRKPRTSTWLWVTALIIYIVVFFFINNSSAQGY
jgi:hypothetical protein